MILLLLEQEFFEIVSSMFGVIVFVVVLAVIISIAKNANNTTPQQKNSTSITSNSYGEKTQHQKEYLQSLRNKKSQQTAAQSKVERSVDFDAHQHIGEEEHYEKIVGSLGDVGDEGCDELADVRLIANDLAYAADDSERDYTEVAKVVVLGDIVNNPRFKHRYGKK